ncbi:alpha-amylase [Mycena rebaudengoi]|nr:alpha-amylase [Mycena rebaudengoi]
MFASFILFPLLVSQVRPALAATAEQWRTRSIYQVITDRFALTPGAVVNECREGDQTWCGGTWNSIRRNLDYIQNAGFTAIWISPVNQNYEGPRTPYGDAYHGYWIADNSQLNARFGTADDLKALSAELHRRDMYLMVDIVVNNVMATSTTPDYSKYMFKDQSLYHPYCPIVWGNTTSEQDCWFGDEKVPLPDVNTENKAVIAKYSEWIADLVKTYSIDGLRIDAAKHVKKEFWPPFLKSAGVFSMGEVFDPLVSKVAEFQGPNVLDSVLNYPLYNALVAAFALPGVGPGPPNMTALLNILQQSKKAYTDTTVLGNFLENQDVPRWHNLSVDPQSLYNAMTFSFLSEGMPIVYYGQEQGFSGAADPYNREPLWPSNYTSTSTYQLITTLNRVRNWAIKTTDWVTQETEILTSSSNGLAFKKGGIVSIVTNLGSPGQTLTHTAFKSPWQQGAVALDVVACRQFVVASEGYLEAEYTKGGVPIVLVLPDWLKGSGICDSAMAELHPTTSSQSHHVGKSWGSPSHRPSLLSILTLLLATFFLGFL